MFPISLHFLWWNGEFNLIEQKAHHRQWVQDVNLMEFKTPGWSFAFQGHFDLDVFLRYEKSNCNLCIAYGCSNVNEVNYSIRSTSCFFTTKIVAMLDSRAHVVSHVWPNSQMHQTLTTKSQLVSCKISRNLVSNSSQKSWSFFGSTDERLTDHTPGAGLFESWLEIVFDKMITLGL